MSNAANTVTLNGQDVELLPLNWKQLKKYREEIIVLNGLDPKKGMFSEEEQDAILKVVTASLQRKRPDFNEDYVSEHLDLGNVGPILRGVFGQPTKQQAAESGEAKAATSQS